MKWRETKEKPCHSKIGIQIYFPSTLKRPIVHATGKYFFQLRFNNDGFLSSCVSQALSTFPAWFFLSTCLLITYSVVGDSSVSIAFCLCFSSAPPPLSLSACYISTPPPFLLIPISLDLLVMNVLSHSIWFTISSKSANLKKNAEMPVTFNHRKKNCCWLM